MEVGRDHQRNPREAAKWFQKARKYPIPTRLPSAISAALSHATLSAMHTSWFWITSVIPARQQHGSRERVSVRTRPACLVACNSVRMPSVRCVRALTEEEAGLFCGSFPRKGEVSAYVGRIQTLKDLNGPKQSPPTAYGGSDKKLKDLNELHRYQATSERRAASSSSRASRVWDSQVPIIVCHQHPDVNYIQVLEKVDLGHRSRESNRGLKRGK